MADKHSSESRACLNCGQPFYPLLQSLKKGFGKFCCHTCFAAHRRQMPKPSIPPESGSRGTLTRSRRHAAKLVEAGLCVRCKKPHTKGTRRCAECTTKAVEQNKRTQREARLSHQCVNCKKPWIGETKRCPECKAAERQKWNGRAGSDYCTRCAGPRDTSHKACSACREEMRGTSSRRRAAFAADGKCVQCGQSRTGPSLYCDEHILKNAARNWLGSSRHWRKLAELLTAQGGRCAYSGEILVLGGNASIDHKTPRSRGGTNDLANVQWVTWTVNRVKTDLTHEEFVSLCEQVCRLHRHV